jgi:23S rRNA (adenine2503-C2)-methyltransferase
MGFNRNLSNGEIVEQVLYFARHLNKEEDRLTNVVIMGMGEPFLNYKATMTAIDRLNNPDGFNFGARRITISTVGIVPGIQKFTSEKRQVNLSISLHAADNALRSSLMPINNKYSLQELMKACGDYIKHTRRRLSFEWALIENVNDGVAQAKKLVKLIKGLELIHVNLIPLNPTHGYAGRGSSYEKAKSFSRILEDNKIPVTIRIRRGLDIHAGCGQLASSHSKDSLFVEERKI